MCVVTGGRTKELPGVGEIGWAVASLCWFEENKPKQFQQALKELQGR